MEAQPKEHDPKLKAELEAGLNHMKEKQLASQSPNLLKLVFEILNFLLTLFKLFRKKAQQKKRVSIFARHEASLPPIVKETLEYLDNKESYKIEGFFRISANLKHIKELKAQYDKGNRVQRPS